jgi:MFS-type transporter involved in bile tolerance (Atg22 family)
LEGRVGEAGGAAAPVRPRASGSAAGRPAARRRLALFLLCLASFMAVVDDTIVTIALPSMRRELGFSEADAGWVLNGYVLAFGGLLLLCGRAADLWGRRRLFLAGLALFGVSSLIGAWRVRRGYWCSPACCRARRRSCRPRSRC